MVMFYAILQETWAHFFQSSYLKVKTQMIKLMSVYIINYSHNPYDKAHSSQYNTIGLLMYGSSKARLQ